jgi:DNA-binding LacI/PurR family transcriptional regulator
MQTPRTDARATSRDVAKLAGLSRTTVSQILNGRDARFPEETRARVAAAATELNYRPSRAGRALVSGVSDLIVIVIPNVTIGKRLQETIARIATDSEAMGLNAVIRYAGTDMEATITTIIDLRPTVVFHLGALDADAIRRVEASGTRVLPSTPPEEANATAFDRHIGALQTRELLKRPLAKLVYAMHADEVALYGPARARGVTEEAHALGVGDVEIVDVPMQLDAAIQVLAPLLSNRSGTVGVACYNDDVALAVLAVARELGLSVPGDVTVVGVDRTDVGQLVRPRLTSIAINVPAIDARFVEELRQLRGGVVGTRTPGTAPSGFHSLVELMPGDSS